MMRFRRGEESMSRRAVVFGAALLGSAHFAMPGAFGQLSGGPYTIRPLDVNAGGTTSTGGPYSISASTGQAGGVGTITAQPLPGPPLYQFDDGFWSAATIPPPTEPPSAHDRAKNRYVSFAPNAGANVVALRIDKVSAPTGGGWVGVPDAAGLAPVVSAPVLRVWSEPVVHVGDCAVVPVASYEVRTSEDGGSAFSAPLAVDTIAQPGPKFWGDTVGQFGTITPDVWDPPNGVVNVNDFLAGLEKFQNPATTRVHLTVVDVVGAGQPGFEACLNRSANIADVFNLIKAFQGSVYPFTTDPPSCPPCP
ncbi:MAG: hypothetical protein HY763_04360 [Planctomycetes bacterium]|nr:hypothetical protein [Planctomycetota bacterium]